ncbi:MAG: alginate export family protein [Xanthomonadales bacterium]|nr:alginate export family protein [Xanthomonadales bacterium]
MSPPRRRNGPSPPSAADDPRPTARRQPRHRVARAPSRPRRGAAPGRAVRSPRGSSPRRISASRPSRTVASPPRRRRSPSRPVAASRSPSARACDSWSRAREPPCSAGSSTTAAGARRQARASPIRRTRRSIASLSTPSPRPGWSLEVGRQYVTDFRQRYFGRSGWRQSRQSFDAARLRIVAGSGFGLELAHLARVWRPAGRLHPDPSERSQRLDTWLLVGELEIPGGRLEGFVHEIGGRGDARVLAHRNRGLRWYGARRRSPPSHRIDLLLEAARQRQRGRYGVAFLSGGRTRPASGGGCASCSASSTEGGNGERAFQTPFGSGHAFNGWADRFSATPADGLLDRFAALMGRHRLGNGGEWILRRHDFRATRGGRRYGSEWNAELTFALRPGLLRLKFADHRGASPEEHLAKLWLSYEISAGGGR